MENNNLTDQSINIQEVYSITNKRTWISPNLQNWNLKNIENTAKGTVVDGVFAVSYF